MDRRHFVKHVAAASMTLPMAAWLRSAEAARERVPSAKNRSMILLWMSGGPSTIDLWDLKPGTTNGGPFKPIATTGAGQICEHLPNLAKQMKHLSIIRSYNSRDGAHERGTYINHTAYAPTPTVVHPAIGAVAAHYNTPRSMEIPGHISLGGPGVSPGFLGAHYAPFRVQAGDDPIPNLKARIESDRLSRRLQALQRTQDMVVAQGRGTIPADQRTIYRRAFDLMHSKSLEAFQIDREETQVRDRYGSHEFGRNCLLARRLVEIGVPFIEVGFGGWDMHQSVHSALATGNNPFLPRLDQGFGALVEDLAERGLLDTTLIVWMGDFGRTPRINQDAGRDHWPSGWSVVLGGGGIKGGEIIGATSADGREVTDRPVDVSNLFATMYKAIGIEPATELRSENGRPLLLTGTYGDGKPIQELF